MSRIEAVVFDMDGVLLDSEPYWQDAEIDVFTSVGVPFTRAMAEETMGMRINEVVELRHTQYPWSGKTLAEVENDILATVVAKVKEEGVPLPGVTHALDTFRSAGLRLALASSSYEVLIDAVMERLGLQAAFEFTYSAQHEEFGKPHPAVYLTAARRLGVDPSHCLAVEDSVNGVKSAKAAGYRCIAVPSPDADRAQFAHADVVLDSLQDLKPAHWS